MFGTKTCILLLALVANAAGVDRKTLEWHALIVQATQQQMSGHFADAENVLQKALRLAGTIDERALAVPVTLNNLGMLYGDIGRVRDAEAAYRQAIARFDQLGAEAGGMSVTPTVNLISLYIGDGRISRAAAELSRFDSLENARLTDSDRMRLHSARASVLQYQRKLAESAEEYMRALQIAESSPAVPRIDLASALSNLGTIEADRRRFDSACRYFERAITVFETAVGADSPRLVLTLLNLAVVVAIEQKRPAEAVPHLERALQISERTYGPQSADTARVLSMYSKALKACGRKKEAKAAEVRARQVTAALAPAPFGRYTVDVNALRAR